MSQDGHGCLSDRFSDASCVCVRSKLLDSCALAIKNFGLSGLTFALS